MFFHILKITKENVSYKYSYNEEFFNEKRRFLKVSTIWRQNKELIWECKKINKRISPVDHIFRAISWFGLKSCVEWNDNLVSIFVNSLLHNPSWFTRWTVVFCLSTLKKPGLSNLPKRILCRIYQLMIFQRVGEKWNVVCFTFLAFEKCPVVLMEYNKRR